MNELATKALRLVGFKEEHLERQYPGQYDKFNDRLKEVIVSPRRAKPNSIFMAGLTDTGKTSLMACLCRTLFEFWLDPKVNSEMQPDIFAGFVKYCTHQHLVNIWENEFNQNSNYENADVYMNAAVLFLDDLGAAPDNVSGRNQSRIEQFIDYRYSSHLKTVVATNLHPDDYYTRDMVRLKRGLPVYHPEWHRVFRRLLNNDWMVTFILTEFFNLDKLVERMRKAEKNAKRKTK